jgi:Flp pilus assembly pilin Flp
MAVEAIIMSERIRRFCSREEGQDIIEYSLLIAFLAIACMWFVASGRGAVNGIWATSTNTVDVAAVAAGS